MEVVFTSPSYVCGERRGAPHVRALLASPRRAGRNTRAHDVRVNGPPKSAPSPCRGAASFCYFVFSYLACKSTEIWNPNRFSNFSEPITTPGHGALLYICPVGLYQNASNRVRVFASPRCCAAFIVCSIPSAGVHQRPGEQVSGTICSCDSAPGEGESGFWEAQSVIARLLHHGSSSVQV